METVTSVLDPVKHQRLIATLDKVSFTAGVPKHFIRSSMKDWCDEQELEFVRSFRTLKEDYHGTVLINKSHVEDRCMAMAGAFIRNFIDARVMSLVGALDAVEDSTMPSPTVLLLPTFQVNSAGKALPAWKLGQLHNLLVDRSLRGLHTVVGVESMSALKTAYGQQLFQVVEGYYGGNV